MEYAASIFQLLSICGITIDQTKTFKRAKTAEIGLRHSCVFYCESACRRMDVYGDSKLWHMVGEPVSSDLVQSAAIPDSISTGWATAVP